MLSASGESVRAPLRYMRHDNAVGVEDIMQMLGGDCSAGWM